MGVLAAQAGMAEAAPPAGLVPHKALYNIELVATHSGSQILNVSGQMAYEWTPSCEAWVTDHKFDIFYEYAELPGMRIASGFSTYESFDGRDFHFNSRRSREGEMYQQIRGYASIKPGRAGKAVYSQPEDIRYDLAAGSLFPMGHTVELIKRAKAGDKFYAAQVFDGSDEEGPIEISSFIGKEASRGEKTARKKEAKVDSVLLGGRAWNMRMAVFKGDQDEEESDYEMSMVFHENGIISDMIIEYDDFSVRQSLLALEKLEAPSCPSGGGKSGKPAR